MQMSGHVFVLGIKPPARLSFIYLPDLSFLKKKCHDVLMRRENRGFAGNVIFAFISAGRDKVNK